MIAEKEYIERDKIGLTNFEIIMCNGNYKEALKILLDKIESIPAADVRLVVHARPVKFFNDPWTGKKYTTCSACDGKIGPKDNFCKHCGAMMEVLQDDS